MATTTAPTFYQPAKGQYDKMANIKTFNWGTNAYVPERELNEIQWIQSEQVADLIRNITHSGILTVNSLKDDENDPHNRSKCFQLFNNDEKHINSFDMPPFKAVVNGEIVYVYNYKNNELNDHHVRLPNPPVGGTRNDFVFLECWFKELKQQDQVRAYGNKDNDILNYHIIDERIELETSRRIQLQWQISNYEDYDELCENGFLDAGNNPNKKIHPVALSGNGYRQKDFYFEQSKNDPYLFVAGNGDTSKIHSFDGYVYAIPLFCIKRINNSGFDQINNPFGGIDYVNSDSVADRPDNKFSNVIYHDQIVDLRHLSAIGEEQYKKIFLTLEDLYIDQTILKNKVNRLTNDIESTNYILQNIGYSIPSIHDNEVYGLNSFRQNGVTFGGYVMDEDGQTAMVYRKNKYYVGKSLINKNYVVVPTVVDYDFNSAGAIGDMYVTQEKKYFVVHNTGAEDLKMHLTAIETSNQKCYSGTNKFNGLDGVKIDLGFDVDVDKHFIYICPCENTNGRNGEIYIKLGTTSFTVYNTGLTTNESGDVTSTINNEFKWIVVDVFNPDIQNIELFNMKLKGTDGVQKKSMSFGDAYTLMIGTPFILSTATVEDGVIGDIYANTEDDNQVTVYNTGSNEVDVRVQCLIFNEIFYDEKYDKTDVRKIIDIDKIE